MQTKMAALVSGISASVIPRDFCLRCSQQSFLPFANLQMMVLSNTVGKGRKNHEH